MRRYEPRGQPPAKMSICGAWHTMSAVRMRVRDICASTFRQALCAARADAQKMCSAAIYAARAHIRAARVMHSSSAAAQQMVRKGSAAKDDNAKISTQRPSRSASRLAQANMFNRDYFATFATVVRAASQPHDCRGAWRAATHICASRRDYREATRAATMTRNQSSVSR